MLGTASCFIKSGGGRGAELAAGAESISSLLTPGGSALPPSPDPPGVTGEPPSLLAGGKGGFGGPVDCAPLPSGG